MRGYKIINVIAIVKKCHKLSEVNVGKSCIIKESEACEDCLSGEQVTLSCGGRVKVLHLAYNLNK